MSSLRLCLQLPAGEPPVPVRPQRSVASPSPQSPNLLGRWLQREHKPGPTAKAGGTEGPRALKASKVILSETGGESATVTLSGMGEAA